MDIFAPTNLDESVTLNHESESVVWFDLISTKITHLFIVVTTPFSHSRTITLRPFESQEWALATPRWSKTPIVAPISSTSEREKEKKKKEKPPRMSQSVYLLDKSKPKKKKKRTKRPERTSSKTHTGTDSPSPPARSGWRDRSLCRPCAGSSGVPLHTRTLRAPSAGVLPGTLAPSRSLRWLAVSLTRTSWQINKSVRMESVWVYGCVWKGEARLTSIDQYGWRTIMNSDSSSVHMNETMVNINAQEIPPLDDKEKNWPSISVGRSPAITHPLPFPTNEHSSTSPFFVLFVGKNRSV